MRKRILWAALLRLLFSYNSARLYGSKSGAEGNLGVLEYFHF
jgi:hypothetical protein